MADLKAVMIGPQHLGQVDHLHDVQERVLGETVDRPALLQEPILAAVGFEDGRARLIGAFYLEAEAECCFIGVSPKATDEAIALAPEVYDFLRKRGIRWLRVHIPREMKKQLDPKLREAGLSCQDDVLSHYAIDLRPQPQDGDHS